MRCATTGKPNTGWFHLSRAAEILCRFLKQKQKIDLSYKDNQLHYFENFTGYRQSLNTCKS